MDSTSHVEFIGDNPNWVSWAKLIVSETKRFGEEIKKIETEIKENTRDINEVQRSIIKLGQNENIELLKKDILAVDSGQKEIKTLLSKDIEAANKDISLLKRQREDLKTNVEGLKEFRTKATTALIVINGLLGVALTVISLIK